jgi:hypothetical protein
MPMTPIGRNNCQCSAKPANDDMRVPLRRSWTIRDGSVGAA